MGAKKEITDLVKAVKNGDEKAFRALYELQVEGLKIFINGFTKDSSQTDDILQDTFIKLWDSRKKIDPRYSIKGYLYTAAYNTYIDKYRKMKREQVVLEEWRYKRILETIQEDDAVNRERVKQVKVAIEKLPPKCKKIFNMCKYDNMKYVEIAESLNISTKTVHAQMCKAYSIIKKDVKFNKTNLLLFVNFFKGIRESF
ncbi:RNA polymerase sigma factor [Snuella sedimenti]|uniref:RNA polymerase sigma-70 factor n=1 Tax=Snuella sedimenti TaxID=2798802 RepID=A0A8J7IFM9_9FLAO|nr:RNA polymerase sigma-70 factor [Snuella sedimenti]MBJ6368057.1 RNA polymerase sigma-70 factor [Snuella sedimenti]